MVILLGVLLIAGGCALLESAAVSPFSARKQFDEIAALEAQVLPVVKNFRVTWYLRWYFEGRSKQEEAACTYANSFTFWSLSFLLLLV